MLSRLAESLYWIGRYIERADDTARIVDSYVHRMVEDPLNNEDATCRSLLSILGIAVDATMPITVEDTLQAIVYDEENPSAIGGALRGAFENARRSRDHISSEMWICLNTTHHRLPHTEMNARQMGPATYLQFVRERAALFTGLTESTLSRDDGWQFLMLGRSIERIDMTARLLTARLVGADHAPDWLALLRACGAMEAFLRSARQGHQPNEVAAFLLLDRLFPRSILYALNTADGCLLELHPSNERIASPDLARQSLARARSRLEFIDPEHMIDQLPDLLPMIEETCWQVNDAISAKFFRHANAVVWSSEGAL